MTHKTSPALTCPKSRAGTARSLTAERFLSDGETQGYVLPQDRRSAPSSQTGPDWEDFRAGEPPIRFSGLFLPIGRLPEIGVPAQRSGRGTNPAKRNVLRGETVGVKRSRKSATHESGKPNTRSNISWHLAVFLVAVLAWNFPGAVEATPLGVEDTSKQSPHQASLRLTGPVNPNDKRWVKDQLREGHSVLLTNSYLFQVMKGVAQENQKSIEEKVLSPLLEQTLKGFLSVSTDEDSRRLFGVPLLLLTDDAGVQLGDEVVKQADSVKRNPMFDPRGHYSESEVLKRYFRAMQYLAKTTINVSIRPALFPYPTEMLYPFETAESIRKLFSDPAHEGLVRGWRMIDSFYGEVNGGSDYPTFLDVVAIAKGKDIMADQVKAWAKSRQLPKINSERGLGIQPLGERVSLHQEIIDNVKAKFMKDDTSRQEIAELLRFENLLKGFARGGNSVKGLADRVASEKGKSYYGVVLRSVNLGAKGWKRSATRLNFYAASTAGLAEQTALMTKTSILLPKSAAAAEKISGKLKLYVEPDSAQYLNALAEASAGMARICRRTAESSGLESTPELKFVDIAPTFRFLAGLSRKRRALDTDSPLWKVHGEVVSVLARRSAAIVDVFQVKDTGGTMHYYHWAVAPFEGAAGSASRSRTKPNGLEMVFFEAWGDDIIPGHVGPINSAQWEGRVLEGNLAPLPTIIGIPQ
jgi:hypothetical protein